MNNLREEDKPKQLEDEQDREADMEDYKVLQSFFKEDDEQEKQKERNKLSKLLNQDENNNNNKDEELTKEQQDEQNQLIEELQRELSQDELFTPQESQMTEEQKQQLKKCMICKIKESKYTCPGCNKKTCSLQCSKDHKIQYNCNGKPNYAGFVDKASYSEVSARKDYQYLRQTLEGTEFIRKKLSYVNHHPELLRLKLLKIYARKKHKIDLTFAPPIMTRHRENISFYYMKSKLIFWTLEIQIISFDKQENSNDNQNNNNNNLSLKNSNNNQIQLQQQIQFIDQNTNEQYNNIVQQQQNNIIKYNEKITRKLIDPQSENQLWSNILKNKEINIFDDELLLKEKLDFSQQGIIKQLEQNELKLFVKNRYRICDVVETKQKENIKSWSFTIPDDYLNLEIPNEYKEREIINKEFNQLYHMIEIHPDSYLSNTLCGSKIKEFPEIILVNVKYLQQFLDKYQCLQFKQNQNNKTIGVVEDNGKIEQEIQPCC